MQEKFNEIEEAIREGSKSPKIEPFYDKVLIEFEDNLFPPLIQFEDVFSSRINESEEFTHASSLIDIADSFSIYDMRKRGTIVRLKKDDIHNDRNFKSVKKLFKTIGNYIPNASDRNLNDVLEEQDWSNNLTTFQDTIRTTMSVAWETMVDNNYIPSVFVFPYNKMLIFLDIIRDFTTKFNIENPVSYYFSKYIDSNYSYLFHPFDNLNISQQKDIIVIREDFNTELIEVKITIRDYIKIGDINQIQKFELKSM